MYKKGQANLSRSGAAVIIALIGSYAGYSWYGEYYGSGSAPIIAGLLFVGITAFGMYICFKRPASVDYLIDMDGELRKVVWPAVLPLFDPKTEAWGSTYVVIVCTILFTVYIAITDMVLQNTISRYLLDWLLT